MKSCFDINKEIGSIEIVTTNFVDIGKAFRYQQKYKRLAENNIVERIRKGAGRTPDTFRMNDLLKIVSGHPVDRFNY